MADLSKYVTYACGVVNYDIKTHDDKTLLLSNFYKFCEDYRQITKFYFICHTDTDIVHIHFIFYFASHVQLMTLFNKMRAWFVYKMHDTRDEYGIQLDNCTNMNSHMRYLVHQDTESKKANKFVYDLQDIVSNDDLDAIQVIVNSVKGEIDAYYLRDCVLDCTSDFEIMNKLGLKVYHKYRYEIEVIKENRVLLSAQRDLDREKMKDEILPF